MNRKQQLTTATFTIALLTYMVVTPFSPDAGHTTPVEWMLFGVAYYFLCKWAFVNAYALHRDWKSKQTRVFVRHSRSHHTHSDRRGGVVPGRTVPT